MVMPALMGGFANPLRAYSNTGGLGCGGGRVRLHPKELALIPKLSENSGPSYGCFASYLAGLIEGD
ncbi:hypothetical protein HK100_010224, partial [Physocladia obscura]